LHGFDKTAVPSRYLPETVTPTPSAILFCFSPFYQGTHIMQVSQRMLSVKVITFGSLRLPLVTPCVRAGGKGQLLW